MEIHDGWNVAHLVMHSAFDELAKASVLAKVNLVIEEIDPIQCFFVAGEIEQRRSTNRKHLVTSVALFQAGMESQINYWQSKHPEIEGGGGFVEKWEYAFESKGVVGVFDDYAQFYRNVRNAVIHPDRPKRIETINNIEFLQVYEGIKAGWAVSDMLSSALGTPFDDNSWGIMCNCHGVPESPFSDDYPQLSSLRGKLYKKHLDHLKNEHESRA